MDIEFHQTPMGRRFYETTMPSMVKQLSDLTGAVQQLVSLIQQGIDTDNKRMAKKEPTITHF